MSRARTQDPEAGPTPLYNTPTSSLSPVRPRIRSETASGSYTDWSGLIGLWVTGGLILSVQSIYDVDTATLVHRLKELLAPSLSCLVQPTDSWGPNANPNFWLLFWMPPTAAMTFTLAHALNPMSSDSKLNVLLLGLRVAGVCLGLPVVAAVVAGVVLGESAGNTLMLSSVMASSSAVIPPTLLMAGLLPMALFQTLAVMVSSSLAGFFLYRATLPRLHATHIRIRVLAALWAIVLATVQLTVI